MNAIQIFEILFYVSLALAVLGLGLAILFFFIFDIRGIYAFRTDKGRQKMAQRMAEQHAKPGRVHHNHESGGLNSGRLGRSGKLGLSGRLGRSGKLGRSGDLGNTGEIAQPYQQPVVHPSGVQTEDIGQPESNETSVLVETVSETSVLTETASETSVLSGNEPPLTTVLNQAPSGPRRATVTPPPEPVQQVQEEADSPTAVLSQKRLSIRFETTEATTVIHTDEMI